VELLMHASTRR